jgi:KDO2-lipid IV(A) lauroyltransferase
VSRAASIRWASEAGAVRALSAGLRVMPVRRRVALGRALGGVAWRAHPRRRRLAEQNVEAALGVGEDRARDIARAAFGHFGRFFAECLSLPAYAREDGEALFEIEGLEHLRRACAGGSGAIVFSGHLGNWELVAQRQALAGYPLDFIARPMGNPRVEAMLRGWREEAGNRVLDRRSMIRRAVSSLRRGRCVALLIDQHVCTPPRFQLSFLGRPAATTATLGRLAARLETPIVPVRSRPRADGGYRIVYHPPLEPARDGTLERRALETTRRAIDLLEGWIREEPEVWLWLHDRWKLLRTREGAVAATRAGLIEETQ